MNLSELNISGNLIDASAGTGKTYQLASRFIALLALGVQAEHMVALTFTRKAAGEFLERIITDLGKAANNPQEARNMWKRINTTLSGFNVDHPDEKAGCAPLCPGTLLGEEAAQPDFYRGKLREVLHSLSSLNLSTLDSFFNKIVSAHSLELGLSDMTLLSPEELEQVHFQTLQSFLSLYSKDNNISEAFLSLFLDISEEKLNGMMDTLQNNIAAFMSIYRNNPDTRLWGNARAFNLPTSKELPSPEVPTDELIRQHEAEINELSQLPGCKDFKTFIEKMKKWSFKGTSKIAKAFDKQGTSGNPELERLLQLAKPIYEQRRHDILRRCLGKTTGMANLLNHYRTLYNREVLATGKLEFDDITRFMPLLLQNGELDVQERLDFNLRHWMLDEFQDTSPQQWAALEPLLTEAISKKAGDEHGNHTLFIVGDEKQSIYGWRGASPELFNMLKEDFFWASHLQRTTMAQSRRSSVQIMDFVNTIFRQEHKNGQFPLHSATGDRAKEPGYVRVSALPAIAQAGQLEEACREIGRLLTEELRFQDGGISVAILVRKNNDGLFIQQWLRKHHPGLAVALLSDTKVAATTPMGEMLMSFFRWLLHPSDRYCSAILRESPLYQTLKEEHEKHLSWSAWRNKLERVGYAAVLSEIATKLTPVSAGQDATIKEWITAAMEFDSTGGTTEEWLLFIESRSRMDNPPKSYIHIMTMHKSKGLEYDAVILPMLGSTSLSHTARMSCLIARNNRNEVSGILLPPGNDDQRQAWPQLEPHIEVWKQKQLKEARNLLYVALTRAARANYILVNGKTLSGNKDEAATFGAMLQEALEIPPCNPSEITTLYEQAPENVNWHKRPPVSTPETAEEEPITLQPPAPQRKHITPSDIAPVHSAGPQSSNTSGSDFGTAVHECFEQITWLNKEQPEWLQAPALPEQRTVAAALQQPDVAALYTHHAGQEAYNEQSVEAITPANEWVSGTIDRLILDSDSMGKITAAHIIDFKTNRPTSKEGYASFHDWLMEHYAPQMRQYRALIAGAFSLPLPAVRCTLISCPRGDTPARVLNYTDEQLQTPTKIPCGGE